MKKGTIMVLLAGMMLMAAQPQTAYAYKLDYNEFDENYYADKYPEVAAECGRTKDALYQHYETAGYAEGRYAKLKTNVIYSYACSQEYFDAERYAAEYPELVSQLGNDPAVLYEHYINTGCLEGRKGFAIEDTHQACLMANDVAFSITNDSMSKTEMVKAVHDWMVNNIDYDIENYNNNWIPGESYTISGAMLNGKAVCSGYAETFLYFMAILNIDCEKVHGTAGGGGHAWNRVLIDGEWKYVDVTWDDLGCYGYKDIRYDYFMISQEEMSKDHTEG